MRDIAFMIVCVTIFVSATRFMCGVFPMQDERVSPVVIPPVPAPEPAYSRWSFPGMQLSSFGAKDRGERSASVGNAIRIARRGIAALINSRGLVGCPVVRVVRPRKPKAHAGAKPIPSATPAPALNPQEPTPSSPPATPGGSAPPAVSPELSHILSESKEPAPAADSLGPVSSLLVQLAPAWFSDAVVSAATRNVRHALSVADESRAAMWGSAWRTLADIGAPVGRALNVVGVFIRDALRMPARRGAAALCHALGRLRVPCSLSPAGRRTRAFDPLETQFTNSIEAAGQSVRAFVTRPEGAVVGFSQAAYPFPADYVPGTTDAAPGQAEEAVGPLGVRSRETVFCSAIVLPPLLGVALDQVSGFWLSIVQWHTAAAAGSLDQDGSTLDHPNGNVPVLVIDWFLLSLRAQWLMLVYFAFMYYVIQVRWASHTPAPLDSVMAIVLLHAYLPSHYDIHVTVRAGTQQPQVRSLYRPLQQVKLEATRSSLHQAAGT